MKNFTKKIALVAVAFLAFSCSHDDENKSVGSLSIAKTVLATPDFSSFAEALDIAGLTSTFENSGNFTVFVPNNDAFNTLLSNLGEQDLAHLETDHPGLIAEVLKYHVLSDNQALSSSLTNNQTLTTLQGQNLTVNLAPNTYYPDVDQDLYIVEQTSIFIQDANSNTARIFARDVKCSNGLIHVINSVLLPAMN